MTAAEEQLVAELAEALRQHRARTGCFCRCGWEGDDHAVHLRDVTLPVVLADRRRAVAEALRAAADSYEDPDEQPAINRLADEVYRPGDCLSSLWLRARADAVEGGGR